MRPKIFFLFNLLLIFTLISSSVFGQKVGVVLSGGGAKGLYHIGVLKALEDSEIPIDYIAGTSMGAIVAAFYASGYSASEIYNIFNSGQVAEWLTGDIEQQYYYQKEEFDGSMVSYDVDINKFISTSKTNSPADSLSNIKNRFKGNNNDKNSFLFSLKSSLQLDMALIDYFGGASAAAKNNFDSLFVPFRCVSVNIRNRKEFLWKKGSLPTAIRSTMAIPMVFRPVEVDSMLMYDGGLMNNFPWQEAKDEFNPDYIIGAVCVAENQSDHSTLLGQIQMLTTTPTNYNMTDTLGIQVSRDVDLGVLDYHKIELAVNQGYDDIMEVMKNIRQKVTKRETKEDREFKREEFKQKISPIFFNKVEIEGLTPKQTDFVAGQFRISRGIPSTYKEFKEDYLTIASSGLFDSSLPKIEYNPISGFYTIKLKMKAKIGLKTLGGVYITSTSINEGYLGVQYIKVGRVSSNYKLTGYLGTFYSNVRASARHNFYGGNMPYYLKYAFTFNYQDIGRGNNQRRSYENKTYEYSKYNSYYMNGNIGLPLGRQYKLDGRVSLGGDNYIFDNSPNKDIVSPNQNQIYYSSANISIRCNMLNYKNFPTRGTEQAASFIATYQNAIFTPGLSSITTGQPQQKFLNLWIGASLVRDEYFNLFKHFTLGYRLQGIYTTMPQMATEYATALALPQFTPTEHSKTLFLPQFCSSSFIAAGLKPILEWNDELYLKTEAYLYMPNILEFKNFFEKWRYIVSSSLVYQSPFGPVAFNYSHYDVTGISKNYYTFSIGVMLFGRRGIEFF